MTFEDAAFFQRHPARQFRIRLAERAEFRDGHSLPGGRTFTIVPRKGPLLALLAGRDFDEALSDRRLGELYGDLSARRTVPS